MPLGAFFPTRSIGTDPGVIRAWAQAVEDLGFDYLDVPDHVIGVDRAKHPDLPAGKYNLSDQFHETMITLAFLAAATERVRLKSAILILPQRPAVLVAKQAAEIDVLSRGRLDLGVGIGWSQADFEALHADWSTRARRQSEQIEVMNRLWTESSVDFEGRWHTLDGVGINPLPVQRPIPIWFGGHVEATVRRAAKYGAGWIPMGKPGERAGRPLFETLQRCLAEEGRDPAGFGIECFIMSDGRQPDEITRAVAAWREFGATHFTMNTSGSRLADLDAEIRALRAFREVVAG